KRQRQGRSPGKVFPGEFPHACAACSLLRRAQRRSGRTLLRSASRARRPPRANNWRKTYRGSSGLTGFARAALRALRQAPGEGLLDRAGALSHERLFGANRLWFSRRPGEGLRRRGRDHLRRERNRPASARLWPWSGRLLPEALSGAPRAKARRLGPSGSLAELDTSGTAPASAATLGSPHGQSRQTRVHPGAAADRGLSRDARRRGRARRDPARCHQLRCGQATRHRKGRTKTRKPRSRLLSLSARRERQDNLGRRLYGSRFREGSMTAEAPAASPAPPQVLLAHHLRQLKLPTFLREYQKVAAEAAREGLDHVRFLLRLAELELIDRERRMVERRIRAAHFSAVKSFDTFDFTAIPSLNKPFVLELARCEYLIARDNVIALGNSGTGKTHVCLALGLAACQRGFPVSFFTAAGLVHQLMEARDERRLLKLQAQLAAVKLLIVDELGYVPLSQTGAELLFEIFSQRHERGSTIVTSNL